MVKMQSLRALYPNIELSRGFGIVQGYLMIESERAPENTGLTWVENLHDDTVHRASNEEEVELG